MQCHFRSERNIFKYFLSLMYILTLCFDRWLGQNSKQNKLSRQLGDVQIRMRLKVSGDKSEIRQSYIPALFPHIVKPLIDVGVVRIFFSIFYARIWTLILLILLQSAVSEVIDRMDEYYLSKEDWDTILELGVDDKKDQIVAKNISTATKTALTKKWVVLLNHPIHIVLLKKIDIMHQSIRYLSTGPRILVRFRRNLREGQHPILRKHM